MPVYRSRLIDIQATGHVSHAAPWPDRFDRVVVDAHASLPSARRIAAVPLAFMARYASAPWPYNAGGEIPKSGNWRGHFQPPPSPSVFASVGIAFLVSTLDRQHPRHRHGPSLAPRLASRWARGDMSLEAPSLMFCQHLPGHLQRREPCGRRPRTRSPHEPARSCAAFGPRLPGADWRQLMMRMVMVVLLILGLGVVAQAGQENSRRARPQRKRRRRVW